MYLVTALSHSIIMPLSIEFDVIKFLEKKKEKESLSNRLYYRVLFVIRDSLYALVLYTMDVSKATRSRLPEKS